jgi:lipid II:glycine glycyltransferase (peptidoglycan interpeptide bridge formation enzyme)
VLERRFPGGFRMAYVPYGPQFPANTPPDVISAVLTDMAEGMREHLSNHCFVIRFDLRGGTRGPAARPSDIDHPPLLNRPLKSAPYRVQPQDTVLLALDGDEEKLMAGMHKKTRYNIRLSERKGVTVRRLQGTDALEALGAWYAIYRETARRDGIALHPESYYQRLFSLSAVPSKAEAATPRFSLYLAEHDGEVLAGIIVAGCGDRSTYMYGASSSLKRELMPNHLLQWTAIKDARAEGALEYDFFGIPPADDPSHPMHGLWRFKTGFGGDILHYLGAWDYSFGPLVYGMYRAAEKLRGWFASWRKRRN